MLIRFKVENYKSFNDEEELLMVAGPTRDHKNHVSNIKNINILHLTAVFGANSSGKSNLVKAILTARNLALYGTDRIGQGDYCRVDHHNEERPVSFEFVLSLGDRIFSYGMEISVKDRTFVSEWMTDIGGSNPTRIFFRDSDGIHKDIELGREESKYFEVYSSEAESDRRSSFLKILSKMNPRIEDKLSPVRQLYQWLSDSLRIILPGRPTGFYFSDSRNEYSKKVLCNYGTGISGIHYGDFEADESPIPHGVLDGTMIDEGMKPGDTIGFVITPDSNRFPVVLDENRRPVLKKMIFEHDGIAFDYSEESDGTFRLFDLIQILDPDDKKDLTYI